MTNTPEKSRIVIVDALRGFALAGVAIVHMVEQYIAGPPPEGFMEGINSLPDQIISGTIGVLLIGKFFALFSILFGLSFSIQMESAERRGTNFGMRFLWRAVLLFGIGYVHQLFYRGDILTIYALLVPFLIPFYKLPSKWILGVAAIFFLSVPRFISYAVFGNDSIFGLPPMMEATHPLALSYFEAIQNGSISEVFQQNADYGMKTKMDFQLLLFGRFYYTFGYFLVGLWLGKIGLFKRMEDFLPKMKKTIWWSIAAIVIGFLAAGAAFGTAPQPVDFKHWQHVMGINCFDWVALSMSVIILCLFILIYQKPKWENRINFFAPYGRMALTNYILQSVIGTFLLFGWGLGFLGQLRTLYLFLIAIILIIFQTMFSKYWLQNFRYGPLEWLWRCGTYMKWQKFKR